MENDTTDGKAELDIEPKIVEEVNIEVTLFQHDFAGKILGISLTGPAQKVNGAMCICVTLDTPNPA